MGAYTELTIDGIVYAGYKEACYQLNLARHIVFTRCSSPRYPTWVVRYTPRKSRLLRFSVCRLMHIPSGNTYIFYARDIEAYLTSKFAALRCCKGLKQLILQYPDRQHWDVQVYSEGRTRNEAKADKELLLSFYHKAGYVVYNIPRSLPRCRLTTSLTSVS